MSFFATLLFKDSHNAQFLAIWIQTTVMNFPMALLLQFFSLQARLRAASSARCSAKKRRSGSADRARLNQSKRHPFGCLSVWR